MTLQRKKETDPTVIDDVSRFVKNVHAEGNPLYPKVVQVLDAYRNLEHLTDKLSRENDMLKTQLVELNRSLDLATRIDPMTGLANRRDIMEKVEQEFSRAQRHRRIFSVILADIDGFKAINDSYGYNTGDDVLVEMSRVLMGSVRSEDVCARWGGEEFLILLPETAIEGALTVAAKIHYSISMTEFKARKPGIRTTVSIGVSGYRQGQTVFDCISAADRALRQAKEAGKNRYIAAA